MAYLCDFLEQIVSKWIKGKPLFGAGRVWAGYYLTFMYVTISVDKKKKRLAHDQADKKAGKSVVMLRMGQAGRTIVALSLLRQSGEESLAV